MATSMQLSVYIIMHHNKYNNFALFCYILIICNLNKHMMV